MAKIEEQVEILIKEKIENLGYELYDVLYIKEGAQRILRIVIDSKNGITLDDCEKVNNEIKDIIDKEDLIQEQYYFEVSSPGIERLLRKDWQLKKYIGSNVEVRLFKKNKLGNKICQGVLLVVEEDYLIIKTNEELKLDRKNIAQVKTMYID